MEEMEVVKLSVLPLPQMNEIVHQTNIKFLFSSKEHTTLLHAYHKATKNKDEKTPLIWLSTSSKEQQLKNEKRNPILIEIEDYIAPFIIE